ncbi:MAG: class I SAM-dependent methyltransferase [Chloroflexota bacterium]
MITEYISRNWKKNYQLLDSGKGRKLEQFGPYTVIRPDQRVVWKPALPPDRWQQADAEFVLAQKGGGGEWQRHSQLPDAWQLEYNGLLFKVALESSRQVGVFPENAVHWDWVEEKISSASGQMRVLNLFGYTGLASLAAARAGAAIVHIDSSKRAIRWGKENQVLSGLDDKPIRWIVDDAVKFVEREIRRGSTYDGIILDPPKYGLGPKKERWEFLPQFERLCYSLRELLSERPKFVVVTAYAIEQPAEILQAPLEKMVSGFGGKLSLGELVSVDKSAGRKISHSITARWEGK